MAQYTEKQSLYIEVHDSDPLLVHTAGILNTLLFQYQTVTSSLVFLMDTLGFICASIPTLLVSKDGLIWSAWYTCL